MHRFAGSYAWATTARGIRSSGSLLVALVVYGVMHALIRKGIVMLARPRV